VPYVPQSTSSSESFSSADVQQLMDMGFSEKQAKKALKETVNILVPDVLEKQLNNERQGNNMERAVDWLFSHAGEDMDLDETPTVESKTEERDSGPAKYRLAAFISHKGTSAHCGHYVAFIKKEGQWVIYNDNKVALVPDINSYRGEGYVYFYERM
jgi:ubiquitin carboxyl-terminal hydrolase 5/13